MGCRKPNSSLIGELLISKFRFLQSGSRGRSVRLLTVVIARFAPRVARCTRFGCEP